MADFRYVEDGRPLVILSCEDRRVRESCTRGDPREIFDCLALGRSEGLPAARRGSSAVVYNLSFRLKLWSDKTMIRFLQTPGPIKKIILGGMLLVICAAMVITLVPGGIGDSIGLGGPGPGVVAKVAGEPVTTLDVQREARQMLRQQFPRGGAQTDMLLPYFAERAAQTLISRKALVAEAERLGLRVTDDEVRDELQHGTLCRHLLPGRQVRGPAAVREHSAKRRTDRVRCSSRA